MNRNIEIIGTDVRATTIHNLFQFEGEYNTKLDFSKATPQAQELIRLEVLQIDEVSMMDDACFGSICSVCSDIDHTRRPDVKRSDCFGPLHVLLYGDFKQLPPASARPPFPVHPVFRTFDVLCLRQNRRVVKDEARRKELESFHDFLNDISHGEATDTVRNFIIDCFERGAEIRTAETVPFEEHTAIFSRRKDRDKWNRTVVRRIATQHNHQTVEIQNESPGLCVCVRVYGSGDERLLISHVEEETKVRCADCRLQG